MKNKYSALRTIVGLFIIFIAFNIGIFYGIKYALKVAGNRYLSEMNYDKALKSFTLAGDKTGKAKVYYKLKKYKEAEKLFKKAENKKGLGYTYIKQREFEKAEKIFKEIKDYKSLGYLYLSKRDWEKALMYFKKAGDLRGIGYLYISQNKFEEALKTFEKINDSSGMGYAYLGMGEYKKALEKFKEADNPVGLGYVYAAMEDYNNSLDCFEKASDYEGMGNLFYKTGDIETAKWCFNSIGDISKMGRVYLEEEEKDPKEIEEMFKESNDLVGLGLLKLRMGNYIEAEKYMELANHKTYLGDVKMEEKDYQGALNCYIEDNNHERIGGVLFALQDYQKAEKEFKRAGKVEEAVRAMLYQSEIEKAESYLEQKEKEGGKFARSHILLAKYYAACGDEEKTLEHLEPAFNDNLLIHKALLVKGCLYLNLYQYEKAEECFNEIAKFYKGTDSYEKALSYLEVINAITQGE